MKKRVGIFLIIFALLLVPGLSVAQSFDNTVYFGAYGSSSSLDTNPDADGMDYGAFIGLKFEQLTESSFAFTTALELFMGTSDLEADSPGTLEKKIERGISLRPGFSFKPARNFKINPYTILGYKNSEFEASLAGLTETDDFSGFELGIGTSFIALDNLDLRFEYSRTFYGEAAGLDFEEDSFRLGLAFHF